MVVRCRTALDSRYQTNGSARSAYQIPVMAVNGRLDCRRGSCITGAEEGMSGVRANGLGMSSGMGDAWGSCLVTTSAVER
jgi:hypothetical protein